jgi:hypothetical protein
MPDDVREVIAIAYVRFMGLKVAELSELRGDDLREATGVADAILAALAERGLRIVPLAKRPDHAEARAAMLAARPGKGEG